MKLDRNSCIIIIHVYIHTCTCTCILYHLHMGCIFGHYSHTQCVHVHTCTYTLKIFWGKQENVGFFDRWNPFSSKVPYTIFASHLMLRRGRVGNDQLKISKVVPVIEEAINDLRKAQFSQQQQSEASANASPPEEYHVKEGDVVIDSYVGLSALVHNDSNLGFFKRRGLMNW